MAAALASDRIGERLSRVRQAAGLSVRALAARAGVRNTTVGYIEQGQHQPAVALVERLALALCVRPAWLAFGEGREPPGLRAAPDPNPTGIPTMSDDPLLARFAALRTWRRRGEQAPHKPLLILLSLARLARGAPRLARFDELEAELKELLAQVGGALPRPEYPFWHLRSDEVWELQGDERLQLRPTARGGAQTPSAGALRAAAIRGGFPEPIHRALQRDPALRQRLVAQLLAQHFPPTQHAALRGALGLGAAPQG